LQIGLILSEFSWKFALFVAKLFAASTFLIDNATVVLIEMFLSLLCMHVLQTCVEPVTLMSERGLYFLFYFFMQNILTMH